MTPSGSRSASLAPGASVEACASETSNVMGIGQSVPSARRISAHTRSWSPRVMKPVSGEKPALSSSSRSHSWRGGEVVGRPVARFGPERSGPVLLHDQVHELSAMRRDEVVGQGKRLLLTASGTMGTLQGITKNPRGVPAGRPGAPGPQPEHEAVVAQRRLVVGERTRVRRALRRVPVDAVAGPDVPLHGGAQSRVDVRPALGEQAELERAADLQPFLDRVPGQEVLQVRARMRAALDDPQRLAPDRPVATGCVRAGGPGAASTRPAPWPA